MADLLLFHHIQGLTPGMHHLAEALRADGHTVHPPDLYGGRTFSTLQEGAAFSKSPEAGDQDRLADAAAAGLPADLVYVGVSSGVMQAQRLAQTRAGARAAILIDACIPVTGPYAFGPWPDHVDAQIHGMDDDEFFAHEGDLEAAQELVELVNAAGGRGELHVYSGDAHLFADDSLPTFDERATTDMLGHIRRFLTELG
jgi:dienelactone hydrolase